MNIRLPAEWEPQSAVMLTWPHPATDWRPWLHDVEPLYVEICKHISRYEKIVIACHENSHRNHVEKLLSEAGIPAAQYNLYIAPSNDSWARDHGPITVLHNGKPVLLDFRFNGWGNKYAADLDDRITTTLHAAGAFGKLPCRNIDFILEGGSIESDGLGTILTTTSCLLSDQRNYAMDRAEIETILIEYLGAGRIIWIEHGQLRGDDTDGHIDTLVRFADPETLLYVSSEGKDDPNFESLRLMSEELKQLRQKNGKPYHLVALPSPVITNDDGDHLPASYVNFLMINHAVLVPVYGIAADDEAIRIFNECFVDRQVIAINCRPLLEQYGSLHCITMHLPEGVVT